MWPILWAGEIRLQSQVILESGSPKRRDKLSCLWQSRTVRGEFNAEGQCAPMGGGISRLIPNDCGKVGRSINDELLER